MNRGKLQVAVDEAHRFIQRAESLPDPIKRDHSGFEDGFYVDDHHPKEQGAIRRASMDLTRALADLRKP